MKTISRQLACIPLYIISCVQLVHGNDWGQHDFRGNIITDYDSDSNMFVLADGTKKSYGELYKSTLPKTLTSIEGREIDCRELGFVSETGKVCFTSTMNGASPEAEYALPLERFNDETKRILSENVITIRNLQGQTLKGVLLEISPDFKSIAFTKGVKRVYNLASSRYKVERYIYHINIDSLDANTKNLLHKKYAESYSPLIGVPRKIIERKIMFCKEMHNIDPVNEADEHFKYNARLREIKIVESTNQQLRRLHESQMSAWRQQNDSIFRQRELAERQLKAERNGLRDKIEQIREQYRRVQNLYNELGNGDQDLRIQMDNLTELRLKCQSRIFQTDREIGNLPHIFKPSPEPSAPRYQSLPPRYRMRESWLVVAGRHNQTLQNQPINVNGLTEFAKINNLGTLSTDKNIPTPYQDKEKEKSAQTNSETSKPKKFEWKIRTGLLGN